MGEETGGDLGCFRPFSADPPAFSPPGHAVPLGSLLSKVTFPTIHLTFLHFLSSSHWVDSEGCFWVFHKRKTACELGGDRPATDGSGGSGSLLMCPDMALGKGALRVVSEVPGGLLKSCSKHWGWEYVGTSSQKGNL